MSIVVTLICACCASAAVASTPPQWSTPVALLMSAPFATPTATGNVAFDAQGNAHQLYVGSPTSGDSDVVEAISDGSSGGWTIQLVYSGGTIELARLVVDLAGNRTALLYQPYDANGKPALLAVRSEAGAAWQSPELVAEFGASLNTIQAAADAAGDVVVATGASTDPGITSYLWSAATNAWQALPQPTSASTISTGCVTLRSNVSDTVIELAYLARIYTAAKLPARAVDVGVVAQRFDAATQSWTTPQSLPGSDYAGISGPEGDLPMVVSSTGVVTIAYTSDRNTGLKIQLRYGHSKDHETLVLANQSSADGITWSDAATVFKLLLEVPKLGLSSALAQYGIAISGSGDVLLAAPLPNFDHLALGIATLHDGAWITELLPNIGAQAVVVNAAAAWGPKGESLAAFYNNATPVAQEDDGSGWSSAVALPEGATGDLPALSMSPTGAVLATYGGLASWLQD